MEEMEIKVKKRKRQYKHILESELKVGKSLRAAERIAAATVNKIKKEEGELQYLAYAAAS